MALPTLDATFASSADLPRRQMLAKWLVEELGSGSIADYYDLPERYLWAKIAVAAGAPKPEAAYISLPKNYAWSDIYNAVSGDIANSAVVVSGLSDSQCNGLYVYDGLVLGRPSYRFGTFVTSWNGSSWTLGNGALNTSSDSDVAYPWLATGWYDEGIDPTGIILTPQTPNHTDWSENVALGHIAAAYRGDTANPANLATYINWPWRYKVASIITHLATPITYNAVIVSGAGSAAANATWTERGTFGGKPYYNKLGDPNSTSSNVIKWSTNQWEIYTGSPLYVSYSDTSFPWQATFIAAVGGSPAPTLTPTNV